MTIQRKLPADLEVIPLTDTHSILFSVEPASRAAIEKINADNENTRPPVTPEQIRNLQAIVNSINMILAATMQDMSAGTSIGGLISAVRAVQANINMGNLVDIRENTAKLEKELTKQLLSPDLPPEIRQQLRSQLQTLRTQEISNPELGKSITVNARQPRQEAPAFISTAQQTDPKVVPLGANINSPVVGTAPITPKPTSMAGVTAAVTNATANVPIPTGNVVSFAVAAKAAVLARGEMTPITSTTLLARNNVAGPEAAVLPFSPQGLNAPATTEQRVASAPTTATPVAGLQGTVAGQPTAASPAAATTGVGVAVSQNAPVAPNAAQAATPVAAAPAALNPATSVPMAQTTSPVAVAPAQAAPVAVTPTAPPSVQPVAANPTAVLPVTPPTKGPEVTQPVGGGNPNPIVAEVKTPVPPTPSTPPVIGEVVSPITPPTTGPVAPPPPTTGPITPVVVALSDPDAIKPIGGGMPGPISPPTELKLPTLTEKPEALPPIERPSIPPTVGPEAKSPEAPPTLPSNPTEVKPPELPTNRNPELPTPPPELPVANPSVDPKEDPKEKFKIAAKEGCKPGCGGELGCCLKLDLDTSAESVAAWRAEQAAKKAAKAQAKLTAG